MSAPKVVLTQPITVFMRRSARKTIRHSRKSSALRLQFRIQPRPGIGPQEVGRPRGVPGLESPMTGRIEELIHIGLVAHHMIVFARACAAGRENAAFFARRPKVAAPEEAASVATW